MPSIGPKAYGILITAVLINTVLASSGDRSPIFNNCVDLCTTDHCDIQQPVALPLALRLTRWSCADDCRYSCMHEMASRDTERGSPAQQYYGKWPFWRFAGMQEPASVAFSLLNLWSHVLGARNVQKMIPTNHPMKAYYLVWSCVSINAWFWSSIFHTRGKSHTNLPLTNLIFTRLDLPSTEKLDYFSAALAILYALYYTVIRLFHLYPHRPQARLTISSNSLAKASLAKKIWSLLCVTAYLGHISYLTLLPRFDYTYNMTFNLILGLTHNVLWLIYSLPIPLIRRYPSQPKSYRPPFAINAAVFVVLTTGATSLELFDFPPCAGIIDAHALWHLSTAPIALFWYDFLVEDALDHSWRDHRV